VSQSGHLSRRHFLVLAVIAIALALQFAVPAMQLTREGPQRWGWQMYSRPAALGTHVAVTQSGSERPLRMSNHVFRFRAELLPSATLVRQLCEREPDAVAIRVRHRDSDRVDEFSCDV
jgi:hypothetical protein